LHFIFFSFNRIAALTGRQRSLARLRICEGPDREKPMDIDGFWRIH